MAEVKHTHVEFGADAQAIIARASEKVYKVAKASYGPKAGNALLGMTYGNAIISRDGVTNISHLKLEDKAEDDVAQVMIQASKKNNQRVGDGTTAVTILAHHLLKEGQRLVAGHENPMAVSRKLEEAGRRAVEVVDILTKQVDNPELLAKVATISAGDPAIGEMIADSLTQVTLDGGVVVENSEGLGITNKIVDGFYFQKGNAIPAFMKDFQRVVSEYRDVAILLTDKRLSTNADIGPILDAVIGSGIKELVIIGEVADEAQITLALNRQKGLLMTTPVEPPVFGGSRTLFLEDLATLTGGTVLTEGSGNGDFSTDMLGAAEKVVINEYSTTIIGADGAKEDVDSRIVTLKEQLAEAEHPVSIQAVKDRLSKLTGKIAIIRVGGAMEVDQKEAKLRVEDAVCAVQAAMRGGIVPGGGVTLTRITGTDFDDAFTQPFRQLFDNAGLNTEKYLFMVEGAKPWHGFDLNNLSDKPVDLLKAGVIDPALVMKEVITNAVRVAASLITVETIVTAVE